MKSTKMPPKVQLDQLLDICVDVSKSKLNVYFELGDRAFDDEWPNTTREIEKKLRAYRRLASEHGLKSLRVICEPSGGYQDKLLQTARRLGHLTAYVNGEAVAKFRVVETNDDGKTDVKDPHIMKTLARLNKTLRHRDLPEEYQLLRKSGVLYDRTDRATVAVRGRLHRALLELFCDYSFKRDFLYSTSGRALMDKYGCNPYRIVRAGRSRFERAMRRRAPRIRQGSLDRLWEDATVSTRHQFTPEYTDLLELQVRQLWEEFLLHEQHKAIFEGAPDLAVATSAHEGSAPARPDAGRHQCQEPGSPDRGPARLATSPAGACSCATPDSISRCVNPASIEASTRSPRREGRYCARSWAKSSYTWCGETACTENTTIGSASPCQDRKP